MLFLPSAAAEAQAISLPEWLELASIVVGSLSGLLVARERKLDVVGYIGLAMLCGLGGGLIRDMMMQRGGVYMLDSPLAIGTSLATAVVVFLFPMVFERFPNLIEWVDIMAVGLFAVMGTDKAIVFGLLPLSALLMGTVTGIGGGMMRDVFLGDVPRIFQSSNFYAICAVAGSAAYWLGVTGVGLSKGVCVIASVVITVALRRLSLRFNVKTPADVDLTPGVAETLRRAAEGAARHNEDRK